jgi:hypothetical protein
MKRLLAILLSVGLLGLLAAPVAAARPATGGLVLDNVTGTTDIGTFAGDVTLTRVQAVGGELVASGTIVGQLTNTTTGAVTAVTDTFTTAISVAQGTTCEILELTLGPLDLDVLGLVVHLDQVHLTIDAEQGPGNLLGNMLCAVAGLLDGPTIGNVLNRIALLLTQILAILG